MMGLSSSIAGNAVWLWSSHSSSARRWAWRWSDQPRPGIGGTWQRLLPFCDPWAYKVDVLRQSKVEFIVSQGVEVEVEVGLRNQLHHRHHLHHLDRGHIEVGAFRIGRLRAVTFTTKAYRKLMIFCSEQKKKEYNCPLCSFRFPFPVIVSVTTLPSPDTPILFTSELVAEEFHPMRP